VTGLCSLAQFSLCEVIDPEESFQVNVNQNRKGTWAHAMEVVTYDTAAGDAPSIGHSKITNQIASYILLLIENLQ
jgi:hypothetical protein